MDYKTVIEEQIQKLQKLQDNLDWTQVDEKDRIASTIASLCMEAQAVDHREKEFDLNTKTMAEIAARKVAQ